MAVIVTLDDTQYTIPQTKETGWGTNVTNYLVALSTSVATKTGTQTLTNKTLDAPDIVGSTLTGTHTLTGTLNVTAGTLTVADNQISGDAIDGGEISNFRSTGIDDDANALTITINSAGFVGVGTTDPQAKLHVSAGPVLISNGQFYTGRNSSDAQIGLIGIDSSNVVQIAGSAIAVDASGNVTMQQELNIEGDAHVAGSLAVSATSTFTSPIVSNGGFAYGALLGDIQTYTSAGEHTWTKPSGLKFLIIEAIGGGGGGGAAGGGGGNASGSGGGGGGYGRLKIAASSLSSTETLKVGTGASGAAYPSNGSTGGDSYFSAFVSAHGGGGGNTAASSTSDNTQTPGNGGTANGGDINLDGSDGGWGRTTDGDRHLYNVGGASGGPYGSEQRPFTGTPSNASGFGNGGCGATATSSNINGPNGSSGAIIIYEYF